MRKCWALDPSERPTFVNLDDMLSGLDVRVELHAQGRFDVRPSADDGIAAHNYAVRGVGAFDAARTIGNGTTAATYAEFGFDAVDDGLAGDGGTN